MIHYLTDYYAMKEFDLTPVPFSNQNDNAFYNFYGETTKISGKLEHTKSRVPYFLDYWLPTIKLFLHMRISP